MMLDTFSEVFVWVGRGANEVEKKEGLKTAQEYIKTDPSDRDMDSTTLIQVTGVRQPLDMYLTFNYTLEPIAS